MPKDKIQTSHNQDIVVKGARVHNLKNITVRIPRNKLVVITGLSGSGKSSLAFDTLYAEGQRRYVESLSSYARQFLGRLDKPEVDDIEGIAPAIAIEQKVNSRNSRSTVGTSTEIYDYLKLLFARIGKTMSPISGKEVKSQTVTDVVDFITKLDDDTRVLLHAPLNPEDVKEWKSALKLMARQGYVRVLWDGKVERIDELAEQKKSPKTLEVVIDRFTSESSEENLGRVADSVEIAFFEGKGDASITYTEKGTDKTRTFSNRFELDGMLFELPSVHFFSFNNPIGACKTCEGWGSVIGIDPDAVIPNKSLSVYDEAIACWKGEKMSEWKQELIKHAEKFDFPIHKPYFELSDEQKKLLWTGNKHFGGIDAFFQYVESKAYKIQYRVMLSRYRGKTDCRDCGGTRLRKDASYVKVDGVSVNEIVDMPLKKAFDFFHKIKLSKHDEKIASRVLIEIKSRLQFLNDVGLGYLTLNRLSNTLSGGESQRINLATSLGSTLVGSMYILDEPSIGLHPHDTHRLIGVIKSLRDLGNTVIVVEHDEEIMKAADHIIDMGPLAGTHGGKVIFEGTPKALINASDSLTANYLTGVTEIPLPERRRAWRDFIELKGAREHNLKNLSVKIPLDCLTVISGISGSGKTSLVKDILYPALRRHFGDYADRMGDFDQMSGSLNYLEAVEFIDQNPIGKSSRSNPVTYVKAYDEIRNLYAKQQQSLIRGYKPSHFSFNVAGGRCDICEGEGSVKIEMQFMADISLRCDSCKGKRFSEETLEVLYNEKNIFDILQLTVDEAVDFFKPSKKDSALKKIHDKLLPLQEVGLGYIQLGQSSNTLSGGEAQRIKLASFLSKGKRQERTLFIFDEPTTGLHFHDVEKLLKALNALIENGNSVLVIEHNTDVIKNADWLIDMGPEGGENGGNIVFEGVPEDIVSVKESLTANYIRDKVRAKVAI